MLSLLVLGSCTDKNIVELAYIKDGKSCVETIHVDNYLNESGNIETDHIYSMSVEKIDSAYLLDHNPGKPQFVTSPFELDMSKEIKAYSPEYYALGVAHYHHKAQAYYSSVFDGKINFDLWEEYCNIKVLLGNCAFYSHPNQLIIEENQLFSPSIFYHEVGHIAFWALEDDLGIKFKGLSPMHVGLLEYFTVSLFDCSKVGEKVLDGELLRDASVLHHYPQPQSMTFGATFEHFKNQYQDEIADTSSFISMYYHISMSTYHDILDTRTDNHRGGILYTSTLWRIREQIGAQQTDKLVAQTILQLNEYMDERDLFLSEDYDEEILEKLMWFDLYYGLIQKDKEMFEGKNKEIIRSEFKRSSFPIDKIQL